MVVDDSEEWSSQLIFQFKQLERRSLKKSGLQRESAIPVRSSTNWAMKPDCIYISRIIILITKLIYWSVLIIWRVGKKCSVVDNFSAVTCLTSCWDCEEKLHVDHSCNRSKSRIFKLFNAIVLTIDRRPLEKKHSFILSPSRTFNVRPPSVRSVAVVNKTGAGPRGYRRGTCCYTARDSPCQSLTPGSLSSLIKNTNTLTSDCVGHEQGTKCDRHL